MHERPQIPTPRSFVCLASLFKHPRCSMVSFFSHLASSCLSCVMVPQRGAQALDACTAALTSQNLPNSREAARCASLLDGKQRDMAKSMRQDHYHLSFGLTAKRPNKRPFIWCFAWTLALPSTLLSCPCPCHPAPTRLQFSPARPACLRFGELMRRPWPRRVALEFTCSLVGSIFYWGGHSLFCTKSPRATKSPQAFGPSALSYFS